MGSRPIRPVARSAKLGLLWLVSSANTHKIGRVARAQAKLTWPGSDRTSGFWQAISVWPWTTATLAGHEAPPCASTTTRMATSTAPMTAPTATLLIRDRPRR